jgi:hypothetical protein
MKRLLMIWLIAFFAFPAMADPPDYRTSPPAVSGESSAAAVDPPPAKKPKTPPDITALKKSQAAPHAGLLVREGRFLKMLKAEGRVPELTRELEVERRLSESIESLYNKKLEEAVKPDPWYKSPWMYFTLGVLVTVAAIYGGAQLVKVAN